MAQQATVGSPGVNVSRSAAAQLAGDLRAACTGLSPGEWTLLVGQCLLAAAVDTGRTRARSLRDTVVAACHTGERYVRLGPRRAAGEDMARLRDGIAAAPGRVRQAWRELRALPLSGQVDEVVGLILTWAVFSATAGGADLEGGLPDTDLLIGVGAHRSVFTHTILLGLEAETAMRLALRIIDRLIDRMPASRHPVWARIAAFLGRSRDRAITAVWAGIGAHLIKDAGLLHPGATKPVTGLPFSMPMTAHQAFLAANGVAAEAVALHSAAERRSAAGLAPARRP